jgi:hypothetical protein
VSRPHTKPAPQPRLTPSHRNKRKQHFRGRPQQTIRFPRTRKTARESMAVATAPSLLTIRDRFEPPLHRQNPPPSPVRRPHSSTNRPAQPQKMLQTPRI